MDLPYQIFDSSGECVIHAPESCRYPRRIELDMLESGYTIKLNGKRLTKTDIRKEIKGR